MEGFLEGFISSQHSSRLNRLTLRFTPERSCWASLPPAVISQIYTMGFEVPLVLQLQLHHPSASSACRYVSWAGAGSAGGGLTLELSPALGRCLGLEEGQVLQVQALPDVPLATQVVVEPADSSDWEVLEHNAEYLEHHLLNQVGVICRGQSFPFWVHQHSVIHLRATATSPADVVRLGRGVELLVAPKPRAAAVQPPDLDTCITPSATPTGLSSLQASLRPTPVKQQPKAAEAPVRMAVLRVAAASHKWLLPLDNSPDPPQRVGPERSSAAPPSPQAHTWLTTAAVVAPSTAAAAHLAPGYPALLCAKPGHSIKQVAVMLLIDDSVSPGHIVLTPPLQQATGALTHTHIKVQQPVVQPALLPSVPATHLHPIGFDSGAPPVGGQTSPSGAAVAQPSAAGAAGAGMASEVNPALQLALSESIHAALCSWLHAQLAAIQAAAATLEAWRQGPGRGVPPHLPFGNMQPQTATAAPLSAVPLAAGTIMHITTLPVASAPPAPAAAAAAASGSVQYPADMHSSVGGMLAGLGSSSAGAGQGTLAGAAAPAPAPASSGGTAAAGSSGSSGSSGVEQCFLVQLPTAHPGSPVARAPGGQEPPIALTTAATLRQQARHAGRAPGNAIAATQLKSPVAVHSSRYPSSPHTAFLLDPSSNPPPPLEDVGWLHEPLAACLQRVRSVTGALPWGPRPWPSQVPRPGGLLLSGAPGGGKTLLMRLLAQLLAQHPHDQVHVVHVQCKQLAGNPPAKVTKVLQAVFHEAQQCWPSLVVLDDLDLLCPSAGDGPEAPPPWSVAALAQWLAAVMDMLGTQEALVACAATVKTAGALHASLVRAGRLDAEVQLQPPGSKGRAHMLAAVLKANGVVLPSEQLQVIVDRADGFDAGDMHTLVQRALHAALARHIGAPTAGQMAVGGGPQLSLKDLEAALDGFEPAAFWGVQSAQDGAEQELSGWEDVGGLGEVREVLYEALELPLRFPALVAAAPLRLRTGLLLFGPPGCGKTHVVNAAVAATGVRFISVKGPELLNKYIGASEAAVQAVFQRAAAAAPCVLFFDEMDSIAPPRGHDSTGVTDRVVNQLLTELDGVEGLKGVCVIGATSRPDLIDAALLRPGRLDRQVYCGFPDRVARLQILRAITRKLHLTADVDLEWIATHSDGFTGADLGAVFSAAQLKAVHRVLDAHTSMGDGSSEPREETPIVCMADVQAAMSSTRPSVPVSERLRLEGVYAQFRRVQGAAGSDQPDVKGKGKRVTLA